MATTIGDDIFFSSLTELSQRLRAKEFSSVELTKAFLDRLEKEGPRYNALALLLRTYATKRAKEIDQDLKKDRLRGPLQGIPYGAKDLLSFAGVPTTWGARPFAGQVFDGHAAVIKNLDKAGARLIGKLAMVELAGGGGYRYASASLFGPGLNPWDRSRWSGGSSSGSASAVSAGLVGFALGSETWGSILVPAAYCGITGLRPTYGLVSRTGAMALSWTMDKIGPMCRSAEDCGTILQVISGGDSDDPGSAGKSFYFAPQFQKPFSEMRIGFASSDLEDLPDDETRKVFMDALDVLRSLGAKLVETKLPELPYSAVASTIIAVEGSTTFEPTIQSGRIDELADQRQIAGLRAGLEIPAKDYLKAMRIRSVIQREMGKLFSDLDVLVSPSRFSVASKVTEPLDRPSAVGPSINRASTAVRGLRDLCAAGNVAGLPALSLPCGFAAGLPLAMQLVSRPFMENQILAIGKEFQNRTTWHKKRPKIS